MNTVSAARKVEGRRIPILVHWDTVSNATISMLKYFQKYYYQPVILLPKYQDQNKKYICIYFGRVYCYFYNVSKLAAISEA